MPTKMKNEEKKREFPVNMPQWGLNYEAPPRWFRCDSTVPSRFNFHKKIWDGVGKLNSKKLETIKFRSGESEEIWTFPQIEICILAQGESLTVIHQVGSRKIEIPVPSTFPIDGHTVRTRTRLFVRVWTPCGSLNGDIGVLTGRGKGYAERMSSNLKIFQNSVVKPVQSEYPDQMLSLSHFKMKLRAAAESTCINSSLKNESSLIYLPELVLDFDDPSEFLLSNEEMLSSAKEFVDAQKWVLTQGKFNADILDQYATEIGYQPVEKMVNAAMPPLPLNGPPGSDIADGPHNVSLPPQDVVPAASYDEPQ